MRTMEKSTAAMKALGAVPAQLAALEVMSVSELAAKHLELYGEPTRSRNKAYLRKRLSWRVQELAEGGLSPKAIERIAELGDELPVRWRMRQAEQPEPKPVTSQRDPRLPAVGSTITRIHQGEAHEVLIQADGFEYRGERFKSLSAIAKRITNVAWNGFEFFNLKVSDE